MASHDDDHDDAPPYWTILSVLFSSQPLTESLARLLYESAYELYRTDRGGAELRGAMVQGTLENLRNDVALGAIAGPTFEANIETERGKGTVRFLLTFKGIEYLATARRPSSSTN